MLLRKHLEDVLNRAAGLRAPDHRGAAGAQRAAAQALPRAARLLQRPLRRRRVLPRRLAPLLGAPPRRLEVLPGVHVAKGNSYIFLQTIDFRAENILKRQLYSP